MINNNCLYIVATPIGHPDDITLRAQKILNKVDVIICEEYRQGSTMLKRIGVTPRELLTLNEHNEQEQVPDIIHRIYEEETFALISDGGTPVFADPGYHLINQAIKSGITIVPLPGPSSLMAALSILNFKLEKYVFGGFLSRKTSQRAIEIKKLRSYNMPIILMDTA